MAAPTPPKDVHEWKETKEATEVVESLVQGFLSEKSDSELFKLISSLDEKLDKIKLENLSPFIHLQLLLQRAKLSKTMHLDQPSLWTVVIRVACRLVLLQYFMVPRGTSQKGPRRHPPVAARALFHLFALHDLPVLCGKHDPSTKDFKYDFGHNKVVEFTSHAYTAATTSIISDPTSSDCYYYGAVLFPIKFHALQLFYSASFHVTLSQDELQKIIHYFQEEGTWFALKSHINDHFVNMIMSGKPPLEEFQTIIDRHRPAFQRLHQEDFPDQIYPSQPLAPQLHKEYIEHLHNTVGDILQFTLFQNSDSPALDPLSSAASVSPPNTFGALLLKMERTLFHFDIYQPHSSLESARRVASWLFYRDYLLTLLLSVVYNNNNNSSTPLTLDRLLGPYQDTFEINDEPVDRVYMHLVTGAGTKSRRRRNIMYYYAVLLSRRPGNARQAMEFPVSVQQRLSAPATLTLHYPWIPALFKGQPRTWTPVELLGQSLRSDTLWAITPQKASAVPLQAHMEEKHSHDDNNDEEEALYGTSVVFEESIDWGEASPPMQPSFRDYDGGSPTAPSAITAVSYGYPEVEPPKERPSWYSESPFINAIVEISQHNSSSSSSNLSRAPAPLSLDESCVSPPFGSRLLLSPTAAVFLPSSVDEGEGEIDFNEEEYWEEEKEEGNAPQSVESSFSVSFASSSLPLLDQRSPKGPSRSAPLPVDLRNQPYPRAMSNLPQAVDPTAYAENLSVFTLMSHLDQWQGQ